MPITEHGQLFLRLYESAIRCLTQAQQDWLGHRTDAVAALHQAVEILRELDAGVDLASGRRTASDLHRIYGFLIHQIEHVEVEGDTFLLREITGLVQELHQSWKAITF